MSELIRADGFMSIEREWLALLTRSVTNTVFLTPQWQRLWWESIGADENRELLFLTLMQGGEIQALAPMVGYEGTLSFLGDTDLFDYHDFIFSEGTESAFFGAFLDYVETSNCHTIDLKSIPGSSPTMSWLPDMARGRGYRVDVAHEDVTPGMALPNDWEEYLGGLSKKDRHELRRKMRRLAGAGDYRIRMVSSESPNLDIEMDWFFYLLKTSRVDKDSFLTKGREIFFRSVADGMKDSFRLLFMELNGEPVAGVVYFDYSGSRLLYNSGLDLRFNQLSVGLLLKALSIKGAIEEGLTYFDFLRGPEPYKYDLGGQDLPIYSIVIKRET
jgi:CelD/BcsL family acetyltransferase involved in cellulose biosynthesis